MSSKSETPAGPTAGVLCFSRVRTRGRRFPADTAADSTRFSIDSQVREHCEKTVCLCVGLQAQFVRSRCRRSSTVVRGEFCRFGACEATVRFLGRRPSGPGGEPELCFYVNVFHPF